MPSGNAPSLTPAEAVELHHQALVIYTQQPPITSGIVFTPGMQAKLAELAELGRARSEVGAALEAALVRDVQTSEEARAQYLDMCQRSGVTVACGTFSGSHKLSAA